MKKTEKKLNLDKFNISKLNNLSKIIGGDNTDDGGTLSTKDSGVGCKKDKLTTI